MYVRCAYFEGTVAPENRERFDRFFEQEVVPLISQFPNIRGVRLLRSEWREEGAPDIYQTIEMTFDSKEDVATALASDARAQNKENTQNSGIMELFQGRLYHINHGVPATA
jgi:uncharacterized protein (TIGR02118 family)